jgi:hypothetical protein
LLAVFATLATCLFAATAYASSIAQRFATSSTDVANGAIVSLAEADGDSVALATITNRSRLVGVASNEASIELGDEASLSVIVSGAAATLVSDFNGAIKAGDRVTVSPIDGVGMKATESVMVVGTAQADMNVSDAEERTITSTGGTSKAVKIGTVPLLVSPGYYESKAGSTGESSQLQLFANNLAGHNVSPIRILVSGVVIIILVVAVIVLIYTSLRSSVIAIGRNPLSKDAVYKSLFEVAIAAFGVSAFAVIMVYLILTT